MEALSFYDGVNVVNGKVINIKTKSEIIISPLEEEMLRIERVRKMKADEDAMVRRARIDSHFYTNSNNLNSPDKKYAIGSVVIGVIIILAHMFGVRR